jgi:hypothetical protein
MAEFSVHDFGLKERRSTYSSLRNASSESPAVTDNSRHGVACFGERFESQPSPAPARRGGEVCRAVYLHLNGDFNFTNLCILVELCSRLEILANRCLDVRQRFLFRGALRPAAGETWTGHAESFFRLP